MSNRYDFKQFNLNIPIISKMLRSNCNMQLLKNEEIDEIINSIIFNDVNFRTTDDNLFTEDKAQHEI